MKLKLFAVLIFVALLIGGCDEWKDYSGIFRSPIGVPTGPPATTVPTITPWPTDGPIATVNPKVVPFHWDFLSDD